jgi:tetratricopeptide (TPR) repeat protein
VRWLLLIGLAFGAGLAALSSGGGGATAPAAVQRPVLTGTSADIPKLQSAVRRSPEREDLRVALADAYLQRVRDTGDYSFYARAEGLLREPKSQDALAAAGELALARHDFAGALKLGRRTGTAGAAIRVDALVELGRYGEAERELQAMVDRKPNLSAYARVSYLRELHGDLPGAVEAMRLAVSAGGAAPENSAYVQSLLGNLEFQRGRLGAATHAYRAALAAFPGYPAAEAGLARVDAARGRLRAAISRLRPLVARLPLTEYTIALGETELAAGRPAAARRDLDLVRVQQRLLAAAGVNTDTELAIFEADHGSPSRGVGLARRAWAAAPSVRSADALGWALTRAGRAREGLAWARRALRLGSRDPMFLYHAGLAAERAGDRVAARSWLRLALARNPRFSPLHAPRARRALESLR